jgi:hypothetical protein
MLVYLDRKRYRSACVCVCVCVPSGSTYHGEADACVAAGGLDEDGGPRGDLPSLLRPVDHGQGNSVLDAVTRLAALQLQQHIAVELWGGGGLRVRGRRERYTGEAEEWGTADQLADAVGDLGVLQHPVGGIGRLAHCWLLVGERV